MEPAPQNAQTASPPQTAESPITLNVTYSYYDYGHPTGSDHATISGTPPGLARILSRLRDDKCNSPTFSVAETGARVSRSTLELWERGIMSDAPKS